MGLDMWIFSGEKLDETELKHCRHSNDLWNEGYHFFDTENPQEPEADISDIIPICARITAKASRTDWKKVLEDYNIPQDARHGGFYITPKQTVMYFYGNDENNTLYTARMLPGKLQEYDIETDTDFFVARLDQISHFTDNDKLRQDIHDVYSRCCGKPITNGGYHHLTPEMIKILNGINEEFAQEYFGAFIYEEESLFYHEWY